MTVGGPIRRGSKGICFPYGGTDESRMVSESWPPVPSVGVRVGIVSPYGGDYVTD
jgi:hypothetical protein